MAPTNEKVSNSIYVPDDIIFSILSKLSMKSVHRFTCVRKSWTLLFENPYFVNMFSKNMVSKYHSLYYEAHLLLNHFDITDFQWKLHLFSGKRFENKIQLNWPYPFNQNHACDYPQILGSAINGTLCIYDDRCQSKIVLWNPATDEVNNVPEDKVRFNTEYQIDFTIHGFGYDHVKDDYKVIQYVNYYGANDYYDQHLPSDPYWDIYSLRSNSWRKLYVDMRKRYLCPIGVGVFLNGVCHWWGKYDRETYVVSFNFSNEVPITTLLPTDLHDLKWADRELAVLNGNVALISKYVKTTSYHVSISILGELGVTESWTKLFDVGPLSYIDHSIGVGKEGNIFFYKNDDELVCLDITTGIIENISVKAEKWRSQILVIY